MSVTADQIEAVAEHAEAVHLVGAAQQLRGRAAHVRLVESQPAEVVKLAAAIRNAYYNDGVRRELLSSRDPGQWLRMAEAASPGRRELRVFNVGDAEPEDRDAIILRGTSNGTAGDGRGAGRELQFKFGRFSSNGMSNDCDRWWQVSERRNTYGNWDYWLEHYGPLTAVLDEPKPPTPRTFEWGDDEPADIAYAYDEDGALFKRLGPDTWAQRLGSGRYGDSRYTWSEVTLGTGATEAFGDLG